MTWIVSVTTVALLV